MTILSLVITIALILILGGYMLLEAKSKHLPKIPFQLLIIYLGIQLGFDLFGNAAWLGHGKRWIEVAIMVVLAWAIVRLTFWLLLEMPLKYLKNQTLPTITRDFILLICYSILFLVVLRVHGNVNLVGIVTTSAALTVVIGIAAQATLGSFFSGLVLQIEHPFGLGDWIKFNEHIGRVVGITWKSTRILTRDNCLVYIPNAQIANSTIYNYSMPDRKVVARLNLGIAYDVAPNYFRKVVMEALRQNPKISDTPRPTIRLIEYGDFAINYEIRFWHTNYTNDPRIRAEVNNQLWYALRRYGIQIPFPIRDIQYNHLERRRREHSRDQLNQQLNRMLSAVPFFEALTPEERERIAQQASIEDFGENEFIVKQGEPGDSLYIILNGTCEVLHHAAQRPARHLATIYRGDFFGEMSLLTGEPRNASVRVTEDTTAIRVDKETFSSIVMANPSICDQIGKKVSQRQHEMTENIYNLPAYKDTTQGIIKRIKSFFGLI